MFGFGPGMKGLLPALPDEEVLSAAAEVYPNARTACEEVMQHMYEHLGENGHTYLLGAAGRLTLAFVLQKKKSAGEDPIKAMSRDEFAKLCLRT